MRRYRDGTQVEAQLFDLNHDPDETTNLARNTSFEARLAQMDKTLRSVVAYPAGPAAHPLLQ